MNIDIQLLPNQPDLDSIFDKTVVVIDVLRATSVIVHAFSQGVKEVIPVRTVEEALSKFKEFPEGEVLLGGERDSRMIEGFHLGNSPKEYTYDKIRGKRLILKTTNGTRAFYLVSSARRVIVGSFLNISAVVEECLRNGSDILIFPAGDEGSFSLEDSVCGGMLIDLIIKRKERLCLTDSALAALLIYQRFEENLVGALHLSRHGKELIDLGATEDILFCGQTDIINVVPFFCNGIIKL